MKAKASKARFFRWFNDRFDRARVVHEKGVRKTIGGKKRAALAYAAIVAVMGFVLWRLPTGFMPDEDIGAVFTLGRRTDRRHPAAHRPRAGACPGAFPDQGKG